MALIRSSIMVALIFLLLTVSCSSNSTPALTQAQTSIPAVSATPTQAPTIIATIPPTPTPTPITPTPVPPDIDLYLPSGISTFSSGLNKVSYYDLRGQLLAELQPVSLGIGSLQQAIIAGPLTLSPGSSLPPLVYFSFENGGELWQNSLNNTSLLRPAPNLLNIMNVPGKDIFVFTLLEYLDSGLRSNLYITDLKGVANVDPILQNTNTESQAIKPLVISMIDSQPSGIWYTSVPYGIGGDIVFEPRSSVTYLNLSDYQTKDYLDMTKAPEGMSDDQTWVAYTKVNEIGPMSIVHNFDFSTVMTFELRPDSDRGSGEAVFSPDNHYLAWKEASGSIADQPSTFHETIRIASVDGTIKSEIPDTSLLSISGFTEVNWLVPVGWIDTQTLILEVQGSSVESLCVVSVKVDGTGLTYLAPGSFVGFLYP